MKQRIYIAYGSNMSEVQMARRCPDAVLAGTGRIRGYELLFKGSLTGCYATIEKKVDTFVPVVFWRISSADERRLDAYEGFPRFYYKKEVEMETDDGIISGLVYIMHEDRRFGIPEDWYYQNMEQEYRKFGFDLSVLRAGLRHSRERMEGTRVRLIAMDDRQAPSSSSMMPEPSMYSGIRAAVLGWYPEPMNGKSSNKMHKYRMNDLLLCAFRVIYIHDKGDKP